MYETTVARYECWNQWPDIYVRKAGSWYLAYLTQSDGRIERANWDYLPNLGLEHRNRSVEVRPDPLPRGLAPMEVLRICL